MSPEKLPVNEVWQTLSEAEQEACFSLSVSEWQSGNPEIFFKGMGIDLDIVQKLVKRGVIDEKPAWVLAEEWIKEHSEKIGLIKQKLSIPLDPQLTREERTAMADWSRKLAIFNDKDEQLRYRLSSQELHEFVLSQMED